ncbi:MAG: hypothetical protein F4X30_06600 [Acidimicrobiaceae bacterium]|nr:hypothetical protein [Acidimicrobiaceae bacterium]
MTAQQLEVLMSGVTAGHVTRPTTPGGPLAFTYDDTYANGPAAVPMSLSMPLQQRRFADARVRGWMAGLLPGHSRVLKHWAAKHGAASIEPCPPRRPPPSRRRLRSADLPGQRQRRPRPRHAGPAATATLDRTVPRHRRVLRRAHLQLADLQHRRPRQELQHPAGTQHSTPRPPV